MQLCVWLTPEMHSTGVTLELPRRKAYLGTKSVFGTCHDKNEYFYRTVGQYSPLNAKLHRVSNDHYPAKEQIVFWEQVQLERRWRRLSSRCQTRIWISRNCATKVTGLHRNAWAGLQFRIWIETTWGCLVFVTIGVKQHLFFVIPALTGENDLDYTSIVINLVTTVHTIKRDVNIQGVFYEDSFISAARRFCPKQQSFLPGHITCVNNVGWLR